MLVHVNTLRWGVAESSRGDGGSNGECLRRWLYATRALQLDGKLPILELAARKALSELRKATPSTYMLTRAAHDRLTRLAHLGNEKCELTLLRGNFPSDINEKV
jgi:hypothetical protein